MQQWLWFQQSEQGLQGARAVADAQPLSLSHIASAARTRSMWRYQSEMPAIGSMRQRSGSAHMLNDQPCQKGGGGGGSALMRTHDAAIRLRFRDEATSYVAMLQLAPWRGSCVSPTPNSIQPAAHGATVANHTRQGGPCSHLWRDGAAAACTGALAAVFVTLDGEAAALAKAVFGARRRGVCAAASGCSAALATTPTIY